MIEIHRSGPIFDGRAEVALSDYVRTTEETIANDTLAAVQERLHEVIRHPTGYYESHLNVDKSFNAHRVNDMGVIYGPWLEGTGSRNRTTRFKGYATFRIIREKMNGEAVARAEAILQRFLPRMR